MENAIFFHYLQRFSEDMVVAGLMEDRFIVLASARFSCCFPSFSNLSKSSKIHNVTVSCCPSNFSYFVTVKLVD